MSGTLGVLIITLRAVWPAFVVLVVLSGFGILARVGHRFPPLRSFLLLYVPFLLLGIWGGLNWGAQAGPHPSEWRGRVLDAMGVVSALAVLGTPWAFRRSPRWWILIPACLAGLVMAAGAWFVGGMAIWDSWL